MALFISQQIIADDSESNIVARNIKSQVIKILAKQDINTKGFCDVFVDMKHLNDDKQAQIVKVSTLGDHQLCMRVKHAIKIGSKYQYQVPERFIRIQISADDL